MMEWLMIALGMTSLACFAIGGTGYKWVRRYVWPWACVMPILFFMGVSWWQCIVASGILCGVMHLGYGEAFGWWGKALVGLSYALPSLAIGYSLWVYIVPVVFLVMFLLSNVPWTEKSFTWKVCEMTYGSVIAYSLIGATLNQW